MSSNSEEAQLKGELIGLDVGEKNIGVARINTIARIGEPLQTIDAGSKAFSDVLTVIEQYGAVAVVVGLPRGLDGQETAQTAIIKKFATGLKQNTETPVYMIDEAGSTKEAENRQISNPGASIDSLAATVFLEDFVNSGNQLLMRV